MITTENLQGNISSEQNLSSANIYPRGENSYLHIKYAENNPVSDEEMSDVINNWIGIYADNIPEDSTSYLKYQWYKIKGENGEQGIPGPEGKSIIEISKVSSDGNINIYRITFSDNTYYDFEIAGGVNKIEKILVGGIEVEIKDKTVNIEISNEIAVSPTEPTTEEVVWIKKGKNLVRKLTLSDVGNISVGQVPALTPSVINRVTIDGLFLEIQENESISVNINSGYGYAIYFCDENRKVTYAPTSYDFISTVTTVPEGAKYVVARIKKEDGTDFTMEELNSVKFMIAYGSTEYEYEDYIEEKVLIKNNAGVFEEYSDIKVGPVMPAQGKIWIKKGKNLYNKATLIKNVYLTETGEIGTSENLTLSDWIEVTPNQQYSYSGVTQISTAPRSCYYDKDKNFISAFTLLTGENTITIPSNAYYVRHSVRKNPTDHTTFQFEQGPTATTYEEYIKKEIYAKNDNGVFEKFYKEEDSVTKIIDITDETYGIRVRAFKQGKNVQICLSTINILTSVATGDISYRLATLPEGARPLENITQQVQTSTNKRFTIKVQTNGGIYFHYNYTAITGDSSEQVYANVLFLAV